MTSLVVFTIGHSTRPFAAFLRLLKAHGVQRVIDVRTMCAEAVPWCCHRSLIADALLVRGIDVREITSGIRSRRHVLTPWARVKGTRLTYPAEPKSFDSGRIFVFP